VTRFFARLTAFSKFAFLVIKFVHDEDGCILSSSVYCQTISVADFDSLGPLSEDDGRIGDPERSLHRRR